MKKDPLVSVIMPVRNGSNYLKEALGAIRAQNVDMEIIVVDDGSSDDTYQIAQNSGCVVIKHESNKGLVSSKNTALKVAKGKYLMFHDHDDVLNDGSLLRMLEEFESDKDIFIVMAQLQDFFCNNLSKDERSKILMRKEPYFGLFSGAILMKREVFDVIGFFDENIKAGDIIEWSQKVEQYKLPIKRVTFVSSNRRIHNSNFGRTNKKTEYKDYSAVLRARIKMAK